MSVPEALKNYQPTLKESLVLLYQGDLSICPSLESTFSTLAFLGYHLSHCGATSPCYWIPRGISGQDFFPSPSSLCPKLHSGWISQIIGLFLNKSWWPFLIGPARVMYPPPHSAGGVGLTTRVLGKEDRPEVNGESFLERRRYECKKVTTVGISLSPAGMFSTS